MGYRSTSQSRQFTARLQGWQSNNLSFDHTVRVTQTLWNGFHQVWLRVNQRRVHLNVETNVLAGNDTVLTPM